MVFLNISASSY